MTIQLSISLSCVEERFLSCVEERFSFARKIVTAFLIVAKTLTLIDHACLYDSSFFSIHCFLILMLFGILVILPFVAFQWFFFFVFVFCFPDRFLSHVLIQGRSLCRAVWGKGRVRKVSFSFSLFLSLGLFVTPSSQSSCD